MRVIKTVDTTKLSERLLENMREEIQANGSLTYPLVNIQKTMENHHAINGKFHYFYGHFQ